MDRPALQFKSPSEITRSIMNPVSTQIGTVFVPVRDVRKARDWYCSMLGVPAEDKIVLDHLYILPMNGTGLVLDSKIYSPDAVFKVPAFHFNTSDIRAAHRFMKDRGVELTDVNDDEWFNFRDPDGNVLMICQIPGSSE
jgi:catechol 2,3-dioxygenase-like lactoylglutathione lyase family enzyme